jgi:hypothetical protein
MAALGIAFYGLRGGRCVPPCRQDYVILTGDIALLATYLALVGTGRHLSMASLVLAVTAIRKLAPYWPILRSTYQRPRRERPGAWLIWAAGYALLGLAVVEAGLPGVLGAYAGVMVAVHLGLALLALRAAGAPGGAAAPSAGPASGGGARAGAALPAHAPSRL